MSTGTTRSPRTVAEALLHAQADHPERPFVRFADDAELSYGECVQRAARLAGALAGAGLKPADRVLMMLDNQQEFLDCWFACALGGFVMVPLNTRLRGPLLADVYTRSRPSAAVIARQYLELVAALPADLTVAAVVGDETVSHWTPFEKLLLEPPAAPAAVRGSDPLSIIFTSGTTGSAKGAILSHAHCVARSGSYVVGLRIDSEDVMYSCLPLFHNNAQMATVLVALLAGGRTALDRRFSVSRFFSRIHATGGTRFTLTGRMANQLLASPTTPHEQDHAIRSACVVPAPKDGDAFSKRFAIRVVSQYYGSTEMIPMPPDLGQPARPGSCGKPGPLYECAVHDPDGEPLADGQPGELVVRPVNPAGMMSGYLDMPAETLHACRGLWFHTGDVVRRDEEGFYYLVGRLKEFIRYKGENISASDVEQVVREHPAIEDAALVGAPDEWGEEEPVLYVELANMTELQSDELASYCRERLPDFMVPARIHFVSSLPRNALGRVEKFKLSEKA